MQWTSFYDILTSSWRATKITVNIYSLLIRYVRDEYKINFLENFHNFTCSQKVARSSWVTLNFDEQQQDGVSDFHWRCKHRFRKNLNKKSLLSYIKMSVKVSTFYLTSYEKYLKRSYAFKMKKTNRGLRNSGIQSNITIKWWRHTRICHL